MTKEERKAKRAEKKERKRREREQLDMETTVADMNVEGFSWYDPNKKKGRKSIGSVTRKEYWAMVRGAFEAILPLILIIIAVCAAIYLLAYLWLM